MAVFADGIWERCGILVGVWAPRASSCPSVLVCLFPLMFLGRPYFVVVGVALLVSSQGLVVCSGAPRGCLGPDGF